jgi:ParB family chromosome partitioning protein
MSGYDSPMAKKKAVRRKKAAAGSVGLTPAEVKQVGAGALQDLGAQVEDEGGSILGQYNDPFGGKPLLIVALPVAIVEPTPYQRDLSPTHA